MAHERLREALEGVSAIVPTPFQKDGSLDLPGLRKNLLFLVEKGVKLIVIGGNTGEFFALTQGELLSCAQVGVEAVAGRSVLLIGSGLDATVACETARAAMKIGADGVLAHQISQPYSSDPGVYDYYQRLSEACNGALVVYQRGPELSDANLVRLARGGLIAGAKYGSPNLDAFGAVAKAAPEVIWQCGAAERWAPFFALLGARGFTSGIVNFAPELSLAMDAALRAGNYTEAMALREQALPIETARARDRSAHNVTVIKAAMELTGLAGGPVRAPLAQMPDQLRQEVTAMVGALGLKR